MNNFVVVEKDSLDKTTVNSNQILLTEASIVHTKMHRENVKEFVREGNDLLLHLKNGEVIVIKNFYVTYDDVKSDLVFEDDACVLFWFDGVSGFKPISGLEVLLPEASTKLLGGWLPWVAGGAAVIGGIAAGGGGSDGKSQPKNKPPVAVDDQDSILKSFPLEVPKDKGVLNNDSDPNGDSLKVQGVVSGASDTVSTTGVNTTIEGKFGSLVMQEDGSYTYIPNLNNDEVWTLDENSTLVDVFTYSISDGKGGTTFAQLEITIEGQSHTPPLIIAKDGNGSIIGDITVYEKGLQNGSDVGVGNITTGDINISALDGLNTIQFGNNVYTRDELLNLEPGHILFSDENGQVIFKGFDPTIKLFPGDVGKVVAGKLSYEYELFKAQEHGSSDDLIISIPLSVTDDQGNSNSGELSINVIDDAPIANDDINTVTDNNDLDPVVAMGNVIGGDKASPSDVADVIGADQGDEDPQITGVQAGVPTTADGHVTEGEVDLKAGKEVLVKGNYGDLVIHADGTYTYTLNKDSLDVKGLIQDEKLQDVFSYTLMDNDGDKSTATLTIDINGSNDIVELKVPEDHTSSTPDSNTQDQVVFESGLSTGTKPNTDDVKVNAHFTIDALDGLSSTDAVTLTTSSGTLTLTKSQVEALNSTSQSLKTPYGEIVLDGYGLDPVTGQIIIDYTYTLTNAPKNGKQDDISLDNISIVAKDRNGDSSTGSVSIKIVDDAPIANEMNAGELVEDDINGNKLEGDVKTIEGNTFGADGKASKAVTWGDVTAKLGTTDVKLSDYGILLLNDDGQWSFTLDNTKPATQALSSTDQIIVNLPYSLVDSDEDIDTSKVSFTILGTNDIPQIQGAAQTGNVTEAGHEDNGIVVDGIPSATGQFTAVDVDADATQTWEVVGTPDQTYGTFDVDNTTGKWTYTLDNEKKETQKLKEGETKELTYTVRVTDDKGAYHEQNVIIKITGTNDAPKIQEPAQTGSVKEAGHEDNGTVINGVPSATGQFTAVDVDADATQTWTVVGTPDQTYGAFNVDNTTGKWTYTLDNAKEATQKLKEGETKELTYTVRVTDDKGAYHEQNVIITITGTNDAPKIQEPAQTGSVKEAGHEDNGTVVNGVPSATGQFTAVDVDADATQTWTVAGTPDQTYGTFNVDKNTGKWTYTLDNEKEETQKLKEGETKELTYTVRVTDDNGAYHEQNVTITITGTNDSPMAFADEAEVKERGVQEGGNTPEVGTSSAKGNVLTNDTDVDSGEKATLQVIEVSLNGEVAAVGTQLTGKYGSLVLNSNGTYTYTLDNTKPATQALPQGEVVSETFNYTIKDVNGATSTSTLTIYVTGTNDKPIITSTAADATGEVTEQGADNPAQTNIVSGKLASTDIDTDAELKWDIANKVGQYGSIVIDSNTGAWVYTLDNSLAAVNALNKGESRTETFNAVVKDEFGAYAEQQITIIIHGSNDAPIAVLDTATVTESGVKADGKTPEAGKSSAVGNVLNNDTDADSNESATLKVIAVEGKAENLGNEISGKYGLLVLNADGTYTYNLDNAKPETQALYQGEEVSETFNYTITDVNGATSTSTLVVQVTGTNDAPVAVADEAEVKESGVQDKGNDFEVGTSSATGNVLTNDTDVDRGEKLTLQVTEVSLNGEVAALGTKLTGKYGHLVLNADGTYTYTLDNSLPTTQALYQGEKVSETFNYTITDVHGATSTSTLTIKVTGTNDQPVITSTEADAKGAVTERGTHNPEEPNTVSGTLTASDVDQNAKQNWSIDNKLEVKGTYGSIVIDPNTGTWTYTLDNSLDATEKLNKGDSRTETFMAIVKDEFGAYDEQPIIITVHGSNDELKSTNGTTSNSASVLEDQILAGTLQDYVLDKDDKLIVEKFSIDGDSISYTPGNNPVDVKHEGKTIGTLVVQPNGEYTFTPVADYSGNVPKITYTIKEDRVDGGSITQDLTITITPVSDAPMLFESKIVTTKEDVAVSLGLIVPQVKDSIDLDTDLAKDSPERLGEITLSNLPIGSKLLNSTDGVVLEVTSPSVKIWLTDVDHPYAMPNDAIAMTSAEFQALKILPPAENSENINIKVEVSSYEVDGSGNKLPNVNGASNSSTVKVIVTAVTDPIDLKIKNGTEVVDAATPADAVLKTIAEDTALDLSTLLKINLDVVSDGNTTADVDGSEKRWITVSDLPVGTIVTVDGKPHSITATESTSGYKIDIPGNYNGLSPALPSITVTPPKDFSGDINGIKITLHAQDIDKDAVAENGIVESDSVYLNLHVTPVAGDVKAGDVITKEDTAVAFLQHVEVTDKATGNEVINQVAFNLKEGWKLIKPVENPSLMTDGYVVEFTILAGYVIKFNDEATGKVLTELERETILDGFKVQPPAHSSKDETITLHVQTTDKNGSDISATISTELKVKVTVEAVAERIKGSSETQDIDTDGDGKTDLTMTKGHSYTTKGNEDAWYKLKVDSFDLADGWSNQDTDESVYAHLTPVLVSGDSAATALGSQFKWTDSQGVTHIATFTGTPIDVPVQHLSSLEFLAPSDVSGTFKIKVEALTEDTDADSQVVDTAISGEAWLNNIVIQPVADGINSLSLNGRAAGKEDTPIALSIVPRSSDPSEVFSVTIADIPVGAKIIYNGVEQVVNNQSVTIDNFDSSKLLTITPPLNSNEDFTLEVTAKTLDGDQPSGASDTLIIPVSVQGVADTAIVKLKDHNLSVDGVQSYTTTELYLDDTSENGGNNQVKLTQLVEGVSSSDTDGSEVYTLRITGLDNNFNLSGAVTVLEQGSGKDRVWIVKAEDLDKVFVTVPKNFSGEVSFKVAGVSTENDGDSKTGALTNVSFYVTPSVEATATENAVLIEDTITSLNFGIVHQNGDTDEVLRKVWIAKDQIIGQSYELFIGTGSSAKALSDAGLPTKLIGNVEYYELTGEQAALLAAKGKSQLDGSLGQLNYKYEVVDKAFGATVTYPESVQEKEGSVVLTAQAVTDPVKLSINSIVGSASTVVIDANTTDKNIVDTATLVASDTVAVNLNVSSDDYDGSERVIRVLVENVPDGVTVEGANAEQIGANTWLIVYEGNQSLAINNQGGIATSVVFNVGGVAGKLSNHPIKITVQGQDRGDSAAANTEIKSDTVTWYLNTEFAKGEGVKASTIDKWEYNAFEALEDTTFTLADVIDQAVTIQNNTVANYFTVTISDLPEGTKIEGMVKTWVDSNNDGVVDKPIWTATVKVDPKTSDENVEAALEALMQKIKITPPENWNENGQKERFKFDATLTGSVVGGHSSEKTLNDMKVPVKPVTDEPVFEMTEKFDAEGKRSIIGTIKVDPADGAFGKVVDGKLYVQLNTALTTDAMEGGKLYKGSDTTALVQQQISNVDGIPDGDYYVIEIGVDGGTVQLTYELPEGQKTVPGNVTFTSYVVVQEANAEPLTIVKDGTVEVKVANNGVTVESKVVNGVESSKAVKANAIELTGNGGLNVKLNDNDGSESYGAILLTNVPVGFLVYVGADAATAKLASNAGGNGDTNKWVLSDNGGLPAYVAVLPPVHWSGTIDGLELVVTSGETSLQSPITETIPLENIVVKAVANGVDLKPTSTFGKETDIIPLNLNASMKDPIASDVSRVDESTETTTVKLSGLGQFATFYLNGIQKTDGITYDAINGTYTITGLTQNDLDKLGFKQAKQQLVDQDKNTAGLQIGVEAWTVESAGGESSHATSTITLNITEVKGAAGSQSVIAVAGNDIISTGLGKDTLIYNVLDSVDNTAGHGVDTWTDFHLGKTASDVNADVLKFSAEFFNNLLSSSDLNVSGLSKVSQFISVKYDAEKDHAVISVDRDGSANKYQSEELVVLLNQPKDFGLNDLLANNQIIIG